MCRLRLWERACGCDHRLNTQASRQGLAARHEHALAFGQMADDGIERTTFLVIATSAPLPPIQSGDGDLQEENPHGMAPTRYERTSELVKNFKQVCVHMREEFHSLEMELPEFTAVLDELTKNTYILVIVHDPTIGARLCEQWASDC